MSDASDSSLKNDSEREQIESRVVEIAPLGTQSPFDATDSSPDGRRALQIYFSAKKKEITDALAGVEGITIKDLAATGTLIVTAERWKWAALTGKGGRLDIDGLRIHENRLVHRAK